MKPLFIYASFYCLLFASSCKKNIEVSPAVGSILSSQAFSTDDLATSAANNMYFQMTARSNLFFTNGITILGAMSADELIPFNTSNYDLTQFQKNSLTSSNGLIGPIFWNTPYFIVYNANSIIEGLSKSSTIHDSVKNELTGEAEFIRAFCNFYLVNLFGDIPLVTTINWHNTNLLSRASTTSIYQSIISDLEDAQKRLPENYSVGHEQRIIPNKWAATALLARTYLYLKDWQNAEIQATAVINTQNIYGLCTDLDSIFLANNQEAIWQLQQNNRGLTYNATPDGYQLIPKKINSTIAPYAYLTNSLLNAFELGDLRKINWIDSSTYLGVKYYFPYKYKIGPGQATSGGAYTEYPVMLRLAEQYLIRAEARAQLAKGEAIDDLNIIRHRAGLSNTTVSNKEDLLNAIEHERQIELFSEWGHRWLDLKRRGEATTILSAQKNITLSSGDLLYPIPLQELFSDPNLSQNPGY